MDILITNELMDILMISLTLSIIVMATIQKFKTLSFITKDNHIFILNIIFSFLLGIPFSKIFFNQNIEMSIWISLFCFIGAPSIYEMLKKQNMINFTPKSLDDKKNIIEVNEENLIKR